MAEVCLYELSKDADGQLSRPAGQQHVCPEDDCRTLTTDQDPELSLRPHDCGAARECRRRTASRIVLPAEEGGVPGPERYWIT